MNRSVTTMIVLLLSLCGMFIHSTAEPEVVYSWNFLDYDWPNATMRNQYESDGSYVKENIELSGIKTHKGKIYVTVSGLKAGVPATLNVLHSSVHNMAPVLHPYPNWEAHMQDGCDSFIFVNSVEIDPNTGYMWILDTGNYPRESSAVNDKTRLCPAKIVIYDVINDVEVHRHDFPHIVVGSSRFFLNNLVLDFVNGMARYAYITDVFDWKFVVYDHSINYSYSFTARSLEPDRNVVNITIGDKSKNVQSLGVSGVAISPDYQDVYYSAVASSTIYRIPTKFLRDFKLDRNYFTYNVREFGKKNDPGDGMYSGQRGYLYFSSFADNTIYKWRLESDQTTVAKGKGPEKDSYTIEHVVTKDNRIEWVSSYTIDEHKYLWFTSKNLDPDFKDISTKNFFIWKVYINDRNYMDFTFDTTPTQSASANSTYLCLYILCILLFYII